MPKSNKCNCSRCAYEKNAKAGHGKTIGNERTKESSIEITSTNMAQTQRLAHSYFQQEELDEAMMLYEKCHRYCKLSTTDPTEMNSDQNALSVLSIEADLWHTMGAVLLTQRKFARAQQHWKNGSHYSNVHDELSHQLEKQVAYQYFCPVSECKGSNFAYSTIRTSKADSTHNSTKAATQAVFIAEDIVDSSTCQNLIQWALDYASNNGGWTTSRHYSVPTTDLPIHKVPNLLEWFQRWMPEVLFPLLRDQFETMDHGKANQRFYVHDAFLVRCVLALNDDFDGGGSYLYSLEQSVNPSTGGMISFLGNRCLHGGTPVTRGVRYILAIFLYQDDDLCCSPPKERPNGAETQKKSRDELTGDSNDSSTKRFKKDEGSTNDGQGCGGFSFSFF
eukprot:jgi/Psemu1/288948/fgenesh1_pg.304_\